MIIELQIYNEQQCMMLFLFKLSQLLAAFEDFSRLYCVTFVFIFLFRPRRFLLFLISVSLSLSVLFVSFCTFQFPLTCHFILTIFLNRHMTLLSYIIVVLKLCVIIFSFLTLYTVARYRVSPTQWINFHTVCDICVLNLTFEDFLRYILCDICTTYVSFYFDMHIFFFESICPCSDFGHISIMSS